jgi:NADPH-dependent 2,4-dienoyl-CoA reductase/sulfur reductase-like enzyme
MRFVIIGGDAAGMSAASRAKRRQPDTRVTVLEQTDDVSYSACGMPYNIADPERDIEDLVVRRADVFRQKQGIDLRTGHRVENINADKRIAAGRTSDGRFFEVPYDELLIATGASAIVPDLPGMDSPQVMVLKSLGDGRRIKSHLQQRPVKEVLIIGMGYVALEMCESLSNLGARVTMIKPRPQLLPWLDTELSRVVGEELDLQGVKWRPETLVDRIAAGGDARNRAVVHCRNRQFEADMVLVAVGVTPNSDFVPSGLIELGPHGEIAVDRKLRTSLPHVWSAGDCADAYHVVTGRKTWIPLALRANRAGWAVADNVFGAGKELDGIAGTAVFKVFDLEVARTGLNRQEAERHGFTPASVTITSISRAHSYGGGRPIFVHMVGDTDSGRLLGVQMVGEEGVAHRINAAVVALHARQTVAQFGQSDLAYAPPFGPTWDPLLVAANQLLKQL